MLLHALLLAATAPVSDSHLALLVVVVLLAIIAPRMIRRNWRSSSRPGLAQVRESVQAMETGGGARRDAERALVDLLEASREINAQIDTKIRILNKLVKDADDEARRLRKLLAMVSGDDVGEAPAPVAPASPRAEDAAGGGGEARFASRSTRRVRDLRARVAVMRAAGKTAAEIARTTGLSLQEISMLSQLKDVDGDSPAAIAASGEGAP